MAVFPIDVSGTRPRASAWGLSWRAGFDVWIPEMRGHGLSQRNHDYARNRVADYARYDLPAIGAFVREQSAQVPHWIGHSLGGTTWRQPWVASTWRTGSGLSGVFGCQVSRTHWPLKIPPVEWTGRLLSSG
jgi:predicted alpha/beta hydrolase